MALAARDGAGGGEERVVTAQRRLLAAMAISAAASAPAIGVAAPASQVRAAPDGVDPRLAAAFDRFDRAGPDQREAARAEVETFAAARANEPAWSLVVGTFWLVRGEWKSAEPWLRRAHAALPGSAPAAQGLGVALLQLSRPEDAEAVLRPAVARFATDPLQGDLRYNLAMACALVNRRLEASEWFERALELAPDSALNHFSLAENELNLARFDRAEAGFRKAMTLSPPHPDARWKLAVTLARIGQPVAAEALFREAAAGGPAASRLAATYQYGVFLFEQGRPAEALPALEAVTRERPDDRMAWNWRARTERALGRKEAATASLARYRELQAEADKSETEFLLGLIRDKLTDAERKAFPSGG
jgi:tetratricopeptide (TPR) repeat protein